NRGLGSGSSAALSDVAKKSVDEFFVQNDAVSVCLLVHRRAKTMRVVDFRAGPSPAKQRFVMNFARKEGVEKVYTLVERDEVQTWMKMGFAKEGNIPAFYKRSDAFMLGTSVMEEGAASPVVRTGSKQSGMRISLRQGAAPIPSYPMDLEEEDEFDEDEEPVSTDTRAHDFAEKTLVHAKKRAKQLQTMALPVAKIAAVKEIDTKKALAAALKSGRAMTAFEPFGRDVDRRYFSITARGGFELVVSIESQACFGNAFLELLTAPTTDAERLATTSAVRALCDKLLQEDVVSVFSLVPSDDVGLAAAFVFNGFRRTGLLLGHVVLGDGQSPPAKRGETAPKAARKDAIIFSRKLANPANDKLPE
ncbi:MAG: hypothetical protein ABI183_18865, partial [Polyangiaceae bacterium]